MSYQEEKERTRTTFKKNLNDVITHPNCPEHLKTSIKNVFGAVFHQRVIGLTLLEDTANGKLSEFANLDGDVHVKPRS
jgi:hypothetical protein